MMKMLSLQKDAVNSGNLILVNRENPYQSPNGALAPVYGGRNTVHLAPRCASVLEKLMDELCVWGQIEAVSGWRSQREQKVIYDDSLATNGAEFTAQYVALPGCSEHQTGLAVDLALNQPDIDALRPHFPYTGICGAFRAKATHYGFIERYPKGKEHITGIAPEPWHFRYVGAPHSRIMKDMGFTLEEYLIWLQEFPYGKKPLMYVFDGLTIEVFYLAASRDDVLLEMDDDVPFTVSGDNMGGFIVTVWRGSV